MIQYNISGTIDVVFVLITAAIFCGLWAAHRRLQRSRDRFPIIAAVVFLTGVYNLVRHVADGAWTSVAWDLFCVTVGSIGLLMWRQWLRTRDQEPPL